MFNLSLNELRQMLTKQFVTFASTCCKWHLLAKCAVFCSIPV